MFALQHDCTDESDQCQQVEQFHPPCPECDGEELEEEEHGSRQQQIGSQQFVLFELGLSRRGEQIVGFAAVRFAGRVRGEEDDDQYDIEDHRRHRECAALHHEIDDLEDQDKDRQYDREVHDRRVRQQRNVEPQRGKRYVKSR